MNIQFHQRKGVNLLDRIKKRIEEQLKALSDMEPKLTQSAVILSKEGGSFLVEIYLKGPYKFDAFAKSKDYVLRTAIDSAINKVKRQLIKYRDKMKK